MTIYEQLIEVCQAAATRIFSVSSLREALRAKYGTDSSSVIPSDHCYNRWNAGLSRHWKPLFERQETGDYLYLGPGHRYAGIVYAKSRSQKIDRVIGEWVDGTPTLFATAVASSSADTSTADLLPVPCEAMSLSGIQIERLLSEYTHILKLETAEFGVKPTEARHLVGRIGELYCASRVGGTLATRVNQCGFDVVSPDGRTISVKTTAQREGFVPIRASTLDRVDDLMVLQYDGDIGLTVLYFGDAKQAVADVRYDQGTGCFELQISRAKRLPSRTIPGRVG